MLWLRKMFKVPTGLVSKAAAPAAAPVAISDSEMDLRGLGRVLWQQRANILGFTLLAAVTAFVVVNTITPRYRSEARLLLEARDNVFLRAEADKNANDRSSMIDPEAVTSQIQLVLSRDLAREVIQRENLTANPEFDPAASPSTIRTILGLFGIVRDPSTMTREERTLETYYERLNVFAIEKSRVIVVAFSAADPDIAARVANDIAVTYLRRQQVAKQDQTRAASEWLAGEIEKMRKKVADAEDKVEQYRTKSNLYAGSNNTSLPSQQLTEMNSQIAAARGQKADLEARARQLRDLIRAGQPIELADIANSEGMRRLIEQRIALRSQLAEQSTTLLDRHPRIKELKAQIAETDRQIRVEGSRLARQLDNDAKVAGDRIETLSASLDQVKKMASQSNEQDVELRALQREAKTQRDLLESYLAKYREASARDNINAAPPEARVISRATPAIKPAYPQKWPTVFLAAFVAFALACGYYVTAALLGPSVVSQTRAYTLEGQGVLNFAAPPVTTRMTSSPPLAPARSVAPPVGVVPPAMPISSLDQVVYKLQQSSDAGRRVAMVGAKRGVGTTATAVLLARALAKDSSVVLVDFAFEAPNLSVISIDPMAPGIAELVSGAASFGDIITLDQDSSVHIVATGNVDDRSELSASPMLTTVIEALARSYDHVVIDIGSAADVPVERFARLAPLAVLVAADPSGAPARAARDLLMRAGFADVTVLAGATESAAA